MKMRAIKFRGLDDAGEWCYGFYYEHEGFSKIWVNAPNPFQPELFSVIVKRETVGQSTGLNDKNGKEIFEGDIIEFNIKEWGGNDNIHVVSWDKEESKFCFGGGCQKSDMEFRTVIGNIYEDKHLLKND